MPLLVPIICFAFFLLFAVLAYRSYQSGSVRQTKSTDPEKGADVAVPGKTIPTGYVVLGLVSLFFAFLTFFMIKSDYRGPKASDQTHWEKQKAREQR